jgi:tyrosine-protein phosphatase
MATTTLLQEADSPSRKRAFADDDISSFAYSPSPKKVEFYLPSIQLVVPTPNRATTRPSSAGRRRKNSSIDRGGRRVGLFRASMQAQSSPRTVASPMPSFMTVFDEESTRRELEEYAGHALDNTHKGITSSDLATSDGGFAQLHPPFAVFHQQRDSISTSTSESSDSSPTTTVSTLDGSSMTEPSPGPSPESPAHSASPLTYVMDASRFKPPARTMTDPMISPYFDMQRPTSSAKKPRNLKNLAVNTTSAYNLGRAIMSAPFAPPPGTVTERTSAPSSPSFVKPPTPPRRKLGNIGLTIKTPGSANITRLAMPPTPSITRPNTLRHFQSSPSLPLCTPSNPPAGGMTLPPVRTRPGPRGFADIPIEDEEEDMEQNFDIPQSQEEKPDSYPNGPIRIYESGIDLYFEPTAEVASQYDVIMNVASEVKNPFLVAIDEAPSPPQPTFNVGILSENSELAVSPSTTPKATPISANPPILPLPGFTTTQKRPEYIHIPWEHNTDIVPDLYDLVKLIDDRVQQGKRVLVHCQCGVSRSASLIVAYGLYKNPGISVQEAYDAVKKRSKWIGPNMNLIMQLQEFRSGLLRNSRRETSFQSQLFTVPRNLSTNLSSASTTTSFDVGSSSTPQTPRTAPLPPDGETSPNRARTNSMGPHTAAPVERGEGSFWDAAFRRSWGSSQAQVTTPNSGLERVSIVQDTPYVDTKGHIIPMVTVIQNQAPVTPPHEPTQEEILARAKSLKRKTPNFSRQLPLRRDYDNDSQMTEAPPMFPTILSPRAEEFHMVAIQKDIPVPSEDTFGILSPVSTDFSNNPFGQFVQSREPQNGDFFSPAVQTTPAPLLPESLKSPSSSNFPFHNESVQPTVNLASPPRKRGLKAKFSSPNLHEARRLQQIQHDIEVSLPKVTTSPKRSFDDLDALMSPRATEFTTNPFHDLLAVRASSEEPQRSPVTPTSSEVDPRSPPIHGISPITRNIFDVL